MSYLLPLVRKVTRVAPTHVYESFNVSLVIHIFLNIMFNPENVLNVRPFGNGIPYILRCIIEAAHGKRDLMVSEMLLKY